MQGWAPVERLPVAWRFNTVSADLTEQSRRDGGFPSLEESLPYHRVG